MPTFLPMTREDALARGWEQLDFIFVSGDAYVDHPSFGPAILCRLLEARGYRIGIIAQPDWRSVDDFKRLGRPRLAFLVSGGNLDSMLGKYTAAKKYRSDDPYSPGGKAGRRPERAAIVYCNRLREAWKKTPVIVGGVEASLRRFSHYDYWSDAVRRSLLLDSRADLLVYGMGEKQLLAIAERLAAGESVSALRDVRGTCYAADSLDGLEGVVVLPSDREVRESKQKFAQAFKLQYLEQDPIRGKTLAQPVGDRFVVQNPPALPLTTAEMDELYALPYARTWHPSYDAQGGVPAIEEVKFSLVSQRGCFGGCHFCAITSHQGRIIQSRSHESLLEEAKKLTALPDFKGYIHDVGGPTANFRIPSCKEQLERGTCRGKQCLAPSPCKQLKANHKDYLRLLRQLRDLPKVKKVFIRSGIRYDYLLQANDAFLDELCEFHVSGQLKVAPEHVSQRVTRLMGKPGRKVYEAFAAAFRKANRRLGKEQYLVPYFMSSHPGAELSDAVELAEFIRDLRYRPEQVQDFIPTPGSLSTCMYYTGIHPLTNERVYVAKDPLEKKMQRALLQYRDPEKYPLVYRALMKAGRKDLIGFGPQCLIRPPRSRQKLEEAKRRNARGPVQPKQAAKKKQGKRC